MEENKCYTYKKYIHTDGLLSNSVDATYILHLDGNGRLPDIERQISEYHITNIVYLVINKGFKKCKKILRKEIPAQDLLHANIAIFEHAKINSYSNILVLEDDFIFDSKITNKTHINNINTFIKSKNNTDFLLQLGTFPIAIFPYNSYINYTISFGCHANIYSETYRNKIINIIKQHESIIWDWDVLNNSYGCLLGKFAYYTPLCYQLCPMTDNRKDWDNYILSIYISTFKIDTDYEPGTSNIYFLSMILSFCLFNIFLFIIVYICILIYKVIVKNTIKSKRRK